MKNYQKFLLGLKNLFSLSGLKKFFELQTKTEKILFFSFSFLFFFSLSFLTLNFYFKFTKIVPKKGGEIILGEIGFPSFLNPVYSISFDTDDSIVELLFSGLMKYQKGEIVPDLVEKCEILEEGKVFECNLKENLFWSDGEKISADDVIFTVNIIQNPEVKSPLRTAWLGVKVEKISDKTFRFLLKEPSSVFFENLTLKIIPKHLWEKIPPQNFHLSYLNLEPVVSGPYKVLKFEKDKEGKVVSLFLIENEKYFGEKPLIPKITFLFFESEEKLIEAVKEKKIEGFSLTKFEKIEGFEVLEFKIPRYFGVFFNLEKKPFNLKEVREALNYATDKREILEKIFAKKGKVVNSPILPEIYGLKKTEKKYFFDLEKAKEILKNAGFQDLDKDGVLEKIEIKEPAFQFKNDLRLGSRGKEVEELQRCLKKEEVYFDEITGYFGPKTKEAVILFQEKYKKEILEPFGLEKGNGIVKEKTKEKLNEVCFERKEEKIIFEFELTTVNQPILLETAKILKNQWEKLGAKVEIKEYEIEDLKRDILPKKEYDALLFGVALGKILDPFSFWHSSQKGEVGLNLSNYKNEKADEILEKIRKVLDEKERNEKLESFQEILLEDAPAVFLFNPDYLYFVSKKIKGKNSGLIFNVSGKFSEIENWYKLEKRVLK